MIPVNEPVLSPEVKTYVNHALDTGWISSAGSYIKQFETNYASWMGVKHAISVTNGTAALHLALASLGIGPGDEVILPDLTIISCAFAVMYTGATPVFVDVDPNTFTLDPAKIEQAITSHTKAIMPVHLYGHPTNMDPIIAIANKHNLKIVEDAAESHGALYKNKKVGSLGDIGCFSFYANKIITTGEGGMIVTNNDTVNEKARLIKDLSHDPSKRFFHKEIGWNYRMTNLAAAVGCAQLLHVDEYIAKKIWMANEYNEALKNVSGLVLPKEMPWAKSVYWMYAVTLDKNIKKSKNQIRKELFENGVDTRDFFYPLHSQPVLAKYYKKESVFPVSDKASERGFYLPSGLALTKEQLLEVAQALKTILV